MVVDGAYVDPDDAARDWDGAKALCGNDGTRVLGLSEGLSDSMISRSCCVSWSVDVVPAAQFDRSYDAKDRL